MSASSSGEPSTRKLHVYLHATEVGAGLVHHAAGLERGASTGNAGIERHIRDRALATGGSIFGRCQVILTAHSCIGATAAMIDKGSWRPAHWTLATHEK